MNIEQLAEQAYGAYGETTGWKSFRGGPMPDWADLGETIQRAWIAATRATARTVAPEGGW